MIAYLLLWGGVGGSKGGFCDRLWCICASELPGEGGDQNNFDPKAHEEGTEVRVNQGWAVHRAL